MLTEIYIEALLVDEELADQVWEAWDAGEANLDRLIQTGKGNKPVTEARFRCRDCGEIVEKQVRPPVPSLGEAVAYI